MPILFDDTRVSTRSPGRSTNGLWLSVGVHVIVVPLIAFTLGKPGTPPEPHAQPLKVFIAPVTLPATPVVTPRLPDPPPPVRERARAEPPKPLPPAPIAPKPVEPAPPPLPAPAAAPERPVDKPVPQRPVETGLFERSNSARANQAEAAVTTGGFGNATTATRTAANGVVTTGGFGSAPAQRAAVNGEVQTAGFDRRASAPQAVATATKPADRPLEIVFKPTPEYTDEARSARIEGTVSLELEFTAAGDVRVLRVVRGLGHGLDEAAERAAVRIRFKPALSDDRPIDSRATVHITFRLS